MIAVTVVHWPGKDTPACQKHADQLKALGGHMGCVISDTPIPEGTQPKPVCMNCYNEAQKQQ